MRGRARPARRGPHRGCGSRWERTRVAACAVPSEAEDVLDLLPREEDDEEREQDEAEQQEEEADARQPLLALVFVARAPLCPCLGKPTLDRDGVDGRVVRRTPMRGWGPDGRTMLTLL